MATIKNALTYHVGFDFFCPMPDSDPSTYLARALREQRISIRGARTHNLQSIDVDIPPPRLVVITGNAGDGFDPEWSPDGRLIAFTTRSNDLAITTVTSPEHFGASRVIHMASAVPGRRVDWHPTWTPDSRWIVFQHGDSRRSGVAMDGSVKAFASPARTPALRSVFALAVDDARGFLWVGTAGAPQYEKHRPEELGGAALLKFDLANGKILEAYPMAPGEAPRMFGAITVAANGTVYATDAISNVVYQVQGGEMRTLFAVPGSTSLRGLAVSPDQRYLYFVDYELGLRVADLSKSEIRELAMDLQNLGGIDGLSYYQGQLIAVQNGTIPTRVIRIKLGEDRVSVVGVQPLEANKDELAMPTFGTLVGDDFYFIANSQRDLYGADGKPMDGAAPEDRVLYKVSARFAWDTGEKGGQVMGMPQK